MPEIETEPKRILVVDDDKSWLDFIEELLLKEKGYSVNQARTLEQFHVQLRENPQLIILNYDFHERINCREILRILNTPRYSNIPVFILTGYASDALWFPRRYRNVVEVFIKGGQPPSSDKELVNAFIKATKRHLSQRISWLHISDLHIGRSEPGCDWQRLQEALLDDLRDHNNSQTVRDNARLAGVAFRPNFLFVTGDIAWTGSAKEYKDALEFLHNIWEITGLSAEQTFFVPGNHDISRLACKNDQVFLMAYEKLCINRHNKEKWHNDLYNIWRDKAFQQVLSKKHRAYCKFVESCYPRNDPNKLFYTEQIPVDSVLVEIVGVNSALMCHKDDEDLERGLWIGLPQIEALRNQGGHQHPSNNNRPCRIFLVHHPSETLHYFDESAWSYMQQYGAIILHGHLHRPDVRPILRPEHQHILVPGGSVHEGGTWASQRYNYVEYNHDAEVFYMYFRRTTKEAFPRYIRDNETFPEEAPEGYVILKLNH